MKEISMRLHRTMLAAIVAPFGYELTVTFGDAEPTATDVAKVR